ncbi:hypothetical protein QE380_001823 [Acinetobacter baylyi]|uniref:Uncharacterized protein n=1 Tax=Acinetobacter baylyi TaxID=202950 RepID=A0ABU0UWG5_ACIBI|nr:hypothetical protein [Acinetobacter baylyi]MDQ1208900.1 hypothetical protein [Acinetobacter baylyi]MDR6107505.1 hypothetical protein [Acinetobacter baylyi]MDR6185772.1 hypothetical protein [Acinetobacter baylyi]
MTAHRTVWQKIQHYSWLVCALACLFLALIFWAVNDSDKLIEMDRSDVAQTQVQIQPEKVTATSHLGMLSDEVKPLDLTTRVVTANLHESEFRGTKFIQENKKNWTIEVFRTSDEDIVKNYLKTRDDRKNFIYLRLTGDTQQEQYVLTYGNFTSDSAAALELKQLNLKLPASVHPHTVLFSSYAPLINDLGADELGLNAQLYEVNLNPVALPRVETPSSTNAPSVTSSTATTSMTVTRRDTQGNVVDVRQSKTSVDPVPATTKAPTTEQKLPKTQEREISDPFN